MYNIYEIIEKDVNLFKDKNFLFECKKNMEYKKENFNSITYDKFIHCAKNFATQLNRKNYLGSNILIIGKNSISYMLADAAITLYVGKCINIDASTPILELEYLVDFYNISLILYGNELEYSFKNFTKCDKMNLSKINFNEEIDRELLFTKTYDECVKIVFSSGTTSNPKGVMLSLRNMFFGWNSLYKRTPFNKNDIIYLCLPLNHTYANLYNFYYSFFSGLSIYLSSNTKNMVNELIEINPTIFCGVPLIFERLIPALPILSTLSNMNYIYCGGAKLEVSLKEEYHKHNLRLLNAYALTETASSFAIDYPNNNIEDNIVGTIFEDLDVKIINEKDGIGDIIVKGDAVFLGYYKNEIATKMAFTKDGYFKTNDIGYIKDNKLYIIGRVDKRISQSNGENIYLDEIKNWFYNKNNNILDINICEKNGKNIYFFYVDKIEKNELELLIELFNKNSSKKDKIYQYEIKQKKQKLII